MPNKTLKGCKIKGFLIAPKWRNKVGATGLNFRADEDSWGNKLFRSEKSAREKMIPGDKLYGVFLLSPQQKNRRVE